MILLPAYQLSFLISDLSDLSAEDANRGVHSHGIPRCQNLPASPSNVAHVIWCHSYSDGRRGVDEPVDASEEPEPIMVIEAEQDELVEAILDANVGLRQSDTKK